MSTMKAILVKDDKGPLENLYLGEAERPKPSADGQVLVKVSIPSHPSMTDEEFNHRI